MLAGSQSDDLKVPANRSLIRWRLKKKREEKKLLKINMEDEKENEINFFSWAPILSFYFLQGAQE